MKVYIRNKLVSLRGSSDVLDENQHKAFVVKGKFFSLHNTKRIYDAHGNKLFVLKNRLLNPWSHKVKIYKVGEGKVATVRDKVISLKPVFFAESIYGEIGIEGEFASLTCNITLNEQILGVVRRQITIIRDAFELEASERNLPFCVALVIAIDNIQDSIRRQR